MKRLIHSKSGFTLVEAMLAILLFTMLFGASLLIYVSGSESWNTNSTRLELQQEVRLAMSRITDDLREAGSSSVIDVLPGTGWQSQITFRKTAGVTSGVIIWSPNTTAYYVGGTNSDQLIEQTGISSTSIAANDITSIQFRRTNAKPDVVEVSMVASKNTFRGRTLTIPMDFDVQLRNW